MGGEEAKLGENIAALVEALKRVRPAAAKGTYFKRVVLATSMGPAVPINVG